MTDVHTCSYYCHRPECIKQQRDQMREWIMDTLEAEKFTEMMTYKPIDRSDPKLKWAYHPNGERRLITPEAK